MGTPRDKDAKRFYQAAKQRLDDAAFLLDAARTTAAVYFAGYCVECMWKALIVTQAGKDKKAEVLESFVGSKAHNFDWLRALYYKCGGPPPSKKDKELGRAFNTVSSWGTYLRYDPATMAADDATEFVDAVRLIRAWADKRL